MLLLEQRRTAEDSPHQDAQHTQNLLQANLLRSNNESKEIYSAVKSQEIFPQEHARRDLTADKLDALAAYKNLATHYDFQQKQGSKPNHRTQSMGT